MGKKKNQMVSGWVRASNGFIGEITPTSQGLNVSMSLSSAVPPWALATVVLVSGLLVFSCCFCLYRKRCRRRLGKKSQAQAQVHLQEVKELGRSYINKVWPGPDPPPCPFSPMPTLFAHLLGGSSPKPDPGELEMDQT